MLHKTFPAKLCETQIFSKTSKILVIAKKIFDFVVDYFQRLPYTKSITGRYAQNNRRLLE